MGVNDNGEKVRKNIKPRFIDSFRHMASTLDKLRINLCDTSDIQCYKYKGDMELVNIFIKYIPLLDCKRWKTK